MRSEYDTLIDAARKAYDYPTYARCMSVERDWSADGSELLSDERCPYTPVRFVPVFDAHAWLFEDKRIQTGIKPEVGHAL